MTALTAGRSRLRNSRARTRALPLLLASTATPFAVAFTAPSALAADAWTTPLTVTDAPAGVQAGLVTRVGVTTNGRGTIAWNHAATGTVMSRDFTVGGTIAGPMTVTKGSLAASVARDAAGNIVVSGQSAGSPATSWVSTRKKDGTEYSFRALESGPAVNAPAAFGLKTGFLVTATNSFVPTTTEQGSPTAAAFGFVVGGTPVTVGKALTAVETGDFAHGADGSNWAMTSSGHAVSTGRRETGKPSKGKAPKSVPALIKVGKAPTRNSILGAERFGAGAIDTAGSTVAVAGLDVQQTAEIAQRGIPVVAIGTEDEDVVTLEETVEIGGVPDRRALEVDVAARPGGGAVVTWLQQTSSRPENLHGQPKWAIVDETGEVVTRGAFSSATDAHDLRVVRAGSLALAIWTRGTGSKAKLYAARLDDDSARIIKAPAGAPLGRLEGGLNTTQLTSNGRIVAVSFVDQGTATVKVAVQSLK